MTTVAGVAVGAVLGALACVLAVVVWSFSATVLGGLRTGVPIGLAGLSGVILGSLIALTRRGKSSPMIPALGLGLLTGGAWLALTRLHPIGLTTVQPFWGIIACLITFVAAAHLVRYGLRDLSLERVQGHTFEVLLLRVMRAAGFTFFLFIVIFPFYFMLISSFKSRAAMLQNPTHLAIDVAQGWGRLFSGYREVLFTFDFLRYIGNSAMVAGITVVVTLVLAILGAYAVTRLAFPGRALMSRSILLIYMFPAIVLVIPLYSVFTQLGLRDTLPGLLIVYPATTIPVALYMLRSYFRTLPPDLEEAGLIDGCTRLEVIWRITLPLSLPALASVGLYVFMIAWNEFLFAYMFLDTPQIFTLSRGMAALNNQEVPRQYLMAGAVIVTVPIMVLFFWFEKYLVGGLTAGGVKG